MHKSFVITSILNNNGILVLDMETKREYIMYGKGIGFSYHKGDIIYESISSKLFVQVNDESKRRMIDLISEIPVDRIEVTQKIISHVENKLSTKLNSSLLWNLADHIDFTIKRYQDGMVITSLINEEIKRFYAVEYEMGKDGVNIINDYYHIHLDESEAGSIAFHIINAMDSSINYDSHKIINGVRDIIAITEKSLGATLSTDSFDYSRYVIHLKFFLKSITSSKTKTSNKMTNYLQINSSEEVEECMDKIEDYIKKIFDHDIRQDERTYLTIHLVRLFEIYKERD